ncbi:MAG TPA: tetratricopeptide repeat protein [Polyangiaceae bacterium]|nr:tetratricopeptide repeat protein [Polyangiaceae bacterium]
MSIATDQSALHEERARLLLQTHRYAEAFAELATALHSRPRDTQLRLLASEVCERLGALPEAADHLSMVIASEPQHPGANRKLAELLTELGDTLGAIRCWRRLVVATGERDPDVVTLLAIALSKDGQHDAAIELLSKLTDRQPTSALPLANLGMALLAADREQDALSALTRALALDPESAQAHCGLGLAHQKGGDCQTAAAAFRATERLAPDSAVGSFNLGLVLERLGDLEGARRALLRAAALEPHDEEIQMALEPLLVRHAAHGDGASSREAGASIQGDLNSFDLLNVLEFLRMQEKTGALVVSARRGVAMLRLEQGMLIGGSAPRLERLGELLVRRGLITAENLRFALSRQRELSPGSSERAEPDANSLGAVLLQEGLVSEKQLADVLFHRILHVVSQVRQWREGMFAFHPAENEGFPVRFNVQKVVLDLMRLEDESQRLRSGATP